MNKFQFKGARQSSSTISLTWHLIYIHTYALSVSVYTHTCIMLIQYLLALSLFILSYSSFLFLCQYIPHFYQKIKWLHTMWAKKFKVGRTVFGCVCMYTYWYNMARGLLLYTSALCICTHFFRSYSECFCNFFLIDSIGRIFSFISLNWAET